MEKGEAIQVNVNSIENIIKNIATKNLIENNNMLIAACLQLFCSDVVRKAGH
jgi:hypothetical protein